MSIIESKGINTEDFWRYSLQRYQSSKLQDQLLSLQNDFDGEVNLALLCLWLDSKNLEIEKKSFTSLETSVVERASKIKSLRLTRNILKSEISSEQYQQILNIELDLEKKQQQDLVSAINNFMLTETENSDNFSFYLNRLGFSSN